MAIDVSDLPYSKNALEPHMSEQTLNFHYDKHHKGYAKKANAAIEGTDLDKLELEDLIAELAKHDDKKPVFNSAAQVWNHDFFWRSMSPEGGGKPDGDLAKLVDEGFGSLEKFNDAFCEAGEKRFGSGYAWLVVEKGALKIITTPNAETPLLGDAEPLLCCDVWEHAYYLDYQNERAKFLKAFVNDLVCWKTAAKRLENAPEEALRKAA